VAVDSTPLGRVIDCTRGLNFLDYHCFVSSLVERKLFHRLSDAVFIFAYWKQRSSNHYLL